MLGGAQLFAAADAMGRDRANELRLTDDYRRMVAEPEKGYNCRRRVALQGT